MFNLQANWLRAQTLEIHKQYIPAIHSLISCFENCHPENHSLVIDEIVRLSRKVNIGKCSLRTVMLKLFFCFEIESKNLRRKVHSSAANSHLSKIRTSEPMPGTYMGARFLFIQKYTHFLHWMYFEIKKKKNQKKHIKKRDKNSKTSVQNFAAEFVQALPISTCKTVNSNYSRSVTVLSNMFFSSCR